MFPASLCGGVASECWAERGWGGWGYPAVRTPNRLLGAPGANHQGSQGKWQTQRAPSARYFPLACDHPVKKRKGHLSTHQFLSFTTIDWHLLCLFVYHVHLPLPLEMDSRKAGTLWAHGMRLMYKKCLLNAESHDCCMTSKLHSNPVTRELSAVLCS